MGVLKRLLKASGISQQNVGTLYQGKTIAQCKGIDTKLLDAIYALGHQHYQSENFETARNIMRYLSVQDHRNPEYQAALGACEYRMKNYEQAQTVLSEAVRINKSDPCATMNLALSLLKGGNKKEAKIFMLEAQQLAADNPDYAREWKLANKILDRSGSNKKSGSQKKKES